MQKAIVCGLYYNAVGVLGLRKAISPPLVGHVLDGKNKVEIFIGTYNVGGAVPTLGSNPSEDAFGKWVQTNSKDKDIVVIGLQEISEMKWSLKGLVTYGAKHVYRSCTWREYLREATGMDVECSKRWLGFGIWVLRKRRDPGACCGLECCMPQGLIRKSKTQAILRGKHITGDNYMGNKGALYASLELPDGTHLGFLNCHLPNRAEGDNSCPYSDESTAARRTDVSAILDAISTDRAKLHALFLFGDFNFRVKEGNKHNEPNWGAIEAPSYQQEMWQLDDKSDIFPQDIYHEAKITFPPTYKYTPDVTPRGFDLSELKKNSPSYTDRVLWTTPFHGDESALKVEAGAYVSCTEATASDHNAVGCCFKLQY